MLQYFLLIRVHKERGDHCTKALKKHNGEKPSFLPIPDTSSKLWLLKMNINL